jgi:hypothetical protein
MLPGWLATICGHLALPVDVAAGLGADPDRFQVVQLAVCLVEDAGLGLGLRVGAGRKELMASLDMTESAVDGVVADLPGS